MSRRGLQAAVILLVMISSLFFLIPSSQLRQTNAVAASQNGVLRLTLVGKPNNLNPFSASPGCESCQQIIGLEFLHGLPVMQNGTSYPNAGVFDWFSSGSNSTVWDFNIRPGETWSDGAPITSFDVNFTYATAIHLSLNPLNGYLNLSSKISRIQLLNTSETQFTLDQSQSDFGTIISNQFYFPLVPAHVWEIQSNDSIISSNNFGQDVTDGPFFHLTYAGGSQLILRANPHYQNAPGLAEIDVTFVASENETLQALRSDQTDLGQVGAQSVSSLGSGFGTLVEPERGILYVEYNISSPVFNNTDFRSALAYGINTSEIAYSVYNGYATPGAIGEGTIPPSATMWYSANATQYQYNVTEAKSLLQSAGYRSNSTGFRSYPNGSSVSFKIYTDSNNTLDSLAAKDVGNYLKVLGIQTTVTAEPLSQISRDYSAGNGDIRNELVVVSSYEADFGFSTTDIMPGSYVYFPWSSSEPLLHQNWLQPEDSQLFFKNFENIAFNVSAVPQFATSGLYEESVFEIDQINSQNLPVIVLAYPDSIWAYRTDRQLSGLPGGISIVGYDLGGFSLDPYLFSQIGCGGSSCESQNSTTVIISQYTGITTFTSSISRHSSSTFSTTITSQTSAGAVSQGSGSTTDEIIAIVVVLGIIAGGTVLSRRKKPTLSELKPN